MVIWLRFSHRLIFMLMDRSGYLCATCTKPQHCVSHEYRLHITKPNIGNEKIASSLIVENHLKLKSTCQRSNKGNKHCFATTDISFLMYTQYNYASKRRLTLDLYLGLAIIIITIIIVLARDQKQGTTITLRNFNSFCLCVCVFVCPVRYNHPYTGWNNRRNSDTVCGVWCERCLLHIVRFAYYRTVSVAICIFFSVDLVTRICNELAKRTCSYRVWHNVIRVESFS